MHILGKPIPRHFSSHAFCLRGVIDYLAHRGELRAHADVIDEAGNLPVVFASLDLAAEQIRQASAATSNR